MFISAECLKNDPIFQHFQLNFCTLFIMKFERFLSNEINKVLGPSVLQLDRLRDLVLHC